LFWKLCSGEGGFVLSFLAIRQHFIFCILHFGFFFDVLLYTELSQRRIISALLKEKVDIVLATSKGWAAWH